MSAAKLVEIFANNICRLNLAVDRIKTIHGVYHAIRAIVDHATDQGHRIDWTSGVGQWAVNKVHYVMRRGGTFGKRDGEALVDIIVWQKENKNIFNGYVGHSFLMNSADISAL
jgi:hypothetical protein